MNENDVRLEDQLTDDINRQIVEITIKIGEETRSKKADAASHKEVIDDYSSERDHLVDEILRRRREA